jgi:hypothetical protein
MKSLVPISQVYWNLIRIRFGTSQKTIRANNNRSPTTAREPATWKFLPVSLYAFGAIPIVDSLCRFKTENWKSYVNAIFSQNFILKRKKNNLVMSVTSVGS